jgi:excisionase family DNA binding protein
MTHQWINEVPPDAPQQLLTVPEAAWLLREHPKTTAVRTQRGEIEVVRLGRKVLIRRQALEAFIASRIEEAVALPGRRRRLHSA